MMAFSARWSARAGRLEGLRANWLKDLGVGTESAVSNIYVFTAFCRTKWECIARIRQVTRYITFICGRALRFDS